MYRSDKQFMRNPATASSRIYVGCIADAVVAADLEDLFKPHGNVLGLSLQKGFGFVQYETENQAQAAIRAEHNKMFHGRKLNVKQAMEKGRSGIPITPLQGLSQPPTPERKAPTPTFEKPSGPPPLLQQTILPPKQLMQSENQEEMMDTDIMHDDSQDRQELENDPFASSDIDDDVDGRKMRNRRGIGPARQTQLRGRQRRDDFRPRDRDVPVHRGEGAFRGRGDIGEGLVRDRPDLVRDRPDFVRDRPDFVRDRPDIVRDRVDLIRDRPDLHRDHGEPLHRERGDVLHRDRGDGPGFFGREEHLRERPAPVFIPPPAIDRPERNDCEIIVVSKALTEYAEFIEQKLKGMGLVVDLLFPNEDVPIGRVLANISSRGCLYAILIMPQNEEFHSLTLNVLHGISQEHRNMPVEDALVLISRNFELYMRGEKPSSVIPNSVAAMLNERHPEQIQILCNLLAENRQITTVQYDRVIKYLQERRDLQSQYEVSESGAELNAEGEPNTKQAELQNRIMNILNKSADEPPKPVEAPPVSQPTGPTPLLNDPSVQKALDSLLSGDMFKSISTGGF